MYLLLSREFRWIRGQEKSIIRPNSLLTVYMVELPQVINKWFKHVSCAICVGQWSIRTIFLSQTVAKRLLCFSCVWLLACVIIVVMFNRYESLHHSLFFSASETLALSLPLPLSHVRRTHYNSVQFRIVFQNQCLSSPIGFLITLLHFTVFVQVGI